VALVWDLKTGEPRAAVELAAKQIIGFALSADGTLFAGGNDAGGVTIWNAETGEAVQQFNSGSGVTATCFSPDGTLLAVATVKNPLGIYKVETGERVASLPNGNGLSLLQFDPTGKYLLGQAGSGFYVWNAKTLADSPGDPTKIELEAEEIDAVAISPDGTKLAVGGKRDSAVWVYDLAGGKLVDTLDTK
jgi:WD40 repeat protein